MTPALRQACVSLLAALRAEDIRRPHRWPAWIRALAGDWPEDEDRIGAELERWRRVAEKELHDD